MVDMYFRALLKLNFGLNEFFKYGLTADNKHSV